MVSSMLAQPVLSSAARRFVWQPELFGRNSHRASRFLWPLMGRTAGVREREARALRIWNAVEAVKKMSELAPKPLLAESVKGQR